MLSLRFSLSHSVQIHLFTVARVDEYDAFLHTYGSNNQRNTKRLSSKIIFHAKKFGRMFTEYKTSLELTPGFLFLVVNKFDGVVEFEAK